MPERLESGIEGNVVDYARGRGCLYLKIQKKRGWPDRQFLYNGRVMFVEFKRPGEEPEPLQRHIHGILRTAGFNVAVVDNVLQGRQHIDHFIMESSHL